MLYSSRQEQRSSGKPGNERKSEMSDLTEDEKLFFYGEEDGRRAWWDKPDFEPE